MEMCLRYDREMGAGLGALLRADTAQPSAGQLWQMWKATAHELHRRQQAKPGVEAHERDQRREHAE